MILFLCAIAVRLSAADDSIAIPKTIDALPLYCAQFVRHMLHHSSLFEESNDPLFSDNWEDNADFILGDWNGQRVNDALLSIARLYSKSDEKEIVSMSDEDRRALFEKATKDMQKGWEEVAVEACPFNVKQPEKWRIFSTKKDATYYQFEYTRFTIVRLGMSKEQACVTIPLRTNVKKMFLAIDKESFARFQETYVFDLGDIAEQE